MESQVSDLSPLKGLPLKNLDINGTPAQSLAPLEGMQVTKLSLSVQHITAANMNVLRGMTSLKTVIYNRNRNYSAADFLKRYEAGEIRRR